MLRRIYLLIILTTAISAASAQETGAIFKIDGQSIYAGEFVRDCAGRLAEGDTTGLYSLMVEYADFRLLDAEARHQRIDTTAQYANAVNYISHSLLSRHIAESPESQRAIAGMASHSQYQYCVSYIRIDIYSNSHGDTSQAYAKAERAISRINSGTPFETVARQMSDAPDCKINGGYLGWVSPIAFKAGMPVCNYIFSHYGDGHKLSRPIRSGSSYYVMLLAGRRPAIDSVTVSPLIIRKRASARYNDSIRGLYASIIEKLDSGADFQPMQYEYSDIKFSETLPLSEAYAKYSTHLLDSTAAEGYTQLIETGDYFLIARIEGTSQLIPDQSYSQKLQEQIAGTETYREAYKLFLDSIRGISNYSTKGSLSAVCRLMPDSSIFEARWNPGDLRHLSQTLLTFGGHDYSYADFASYIYNNQYTTGYSKIQEYVSMRYREYIDALTLQEAYKYLRQNDNTYKTRYQKSITATRAEMLKSSREYPRPSADTMAVMAYYRENMRPMTTGYTLNLEMYDYQNPANKKKAVRSLEAMAGGAILSDPILRPAGKGTYQLGQDPTADRIISGFDSGRYNEGDRIIYLDDINTAAIVSVAGSPEELPKEEIFALARPQYNRSRLSHYISRLRSKHTLQILPGAYETLANTITD